MRSAISGCLGALGSLLIFGLIGGGLAYWGWTILQDAQASASWPSVPGVVTSSRVDVSSDSEGGDSYSPEVSYRYEIDGQIFNDSQIKFGENSYGSRRKAQEIVARYPTGSQVTVYYEPERPSNAVLEPGVTTGSYLVLCLGLFFVGIAFITATFSLIGRRR